MSSGAAVLLAATAFAVGCAGPVTSTSPGTSFTATAGQGCMNHQLKSPSIIDRSSNEDVAQRLIVLRYYTAHGRQPFCDGRPATHADLSWMQLFVSQGAQAALVDRWLHP